MDGPLVGVFLPRASNRPASFSGMGGHGKYAGKIGETMINMDLASNCVLMTSFSISIFSAPGLARCFLKQKNILIANENIYVGLRILIKHNLAWFQCCAGIWSCSNLPFLDEFGPLSLPTPPSELFALERDLWLINWGEVNRSSERFPGLMLVVIPKWVQAERPGHPLQRRLQNRLNKTITWTGVVLMQIFVSKTPNKDLQSS